MVACIVALIVFSILGIFSVRWRRLAKEAFDCVFRMVTFRPCKTKLDQRIKSRLTAKLMKRSTKLAKIIYKYFTVFSIIFTLSFFASMIYTAYGIYNLVTYGSCDPSSGYCGVNHVTEFISCYETQIIYAILIVVVVILMYLGLKHLK